MEPFITSSTGDETIGLKISVYEGTSRACIEMTSEGTGTDVRLHMPISKMSLMKMKAWIDKFLEKS